MKKLGLILLFIASLFILVSCKSTVPPSRETTTNSVIKETLHDTVFKIEKDSSSYNALLECINGKVKIKEVTQSEAGRNLKSPKVRIEDNQLKVDCEARAQELLAQYKNTLSTTTTEIVITKTIEVNKLTFWQKAQIWAGRIFLVLLLLVLVSWYLKFKKII